MGRQRFLVGQAKHFKLTKLRTFSVSYEWVKKKQQAAMDMASKEGLP